MHSPAPRRTTSTSTAWMVGVLCSSGTIVSLQQTMLVPLLPDLPKLLDTSANNASWVVTATLLTSCVATPIVARLADMYGKRLMMLVAMAAMVLGSVIGALSLTLPVVVLARALQGLGTALIPIGISIMRDELPREKIGSAIALMSATLGIGGAVGLPLSGLIYQTADWHSLFWISAAMGAVGLVVVPLVVPESPVRSGGRFDFPGTVLLSVALTTLLLAISKGSQWGWTSAAILGLFATSALVLAGWVPFELRTSMPLVDIRTSARRPVLLTNIASVLVGFAMFCNMLAVSQLLQMPPETGYGFGFSVIQAGLFMLPTGLIMAVLAPVSAAISRRYGPKTTLITGSLLMAAGYVGLIFLTQDPMRMLVGTTIIGCGTAIGYAAMPTLLMRTVPIHETAAANGLNTLLRAVGTSTGSAAVAAMLTAGVVTTGGVSAPSLGAYQQVFLLAAIVAATAAVVAFALPAHTQDPTPDEEPTGHAGDTGLPTSPSSKVHP